MSNIQQFHEKNKLTLEIALKGEQISNYVAKAGREDTMMVIAASIIDLSEHLNISQNINGQQAVSIAETILRDYWHIKLAELWIFFDKCKNGRYGQIYNRLDQATIINWLDIYMGERADELEKINHNKKHVDQVSNTELMAIFMLEYKTRFPDAYTAMEKKAQGQTLAEKLNDPEFKRWQAQRAYEKAKAEKEAKGDDRRK